MYTTAIINILSTKEGQLALYQRGRTVTWEN